MTVRRKKNPVASVITTSTPISHSSCGRMLTPARSSGISPVNDGTIIGSEPHAMVTTPRRQIANPMVSSTTCAMVAPAAGRIANQ